MTENQPIDHNSIEASMRRDSVPVRDIAQNFLQKKQYELPFNRINEILKKESSELGGILKVFEILLSIHDAIADKSRLISDQDRQSQFLYAHALGREVIGDDQLLRLLTNYFKELKNITFPKLPLPDEELSHKERLEDRVYESYITDSRSYRVLRHILSPDLEKNGALLEAIITLVERSAEFASGGFKNEDAYPILSIGSLMDTFQRSTDKYFDHRNDTSATVYDALEDFGYHATGLKVDACQLALVQDVQELLQQCDETGLNPEEKQNAVRDFLQKQKFVAMTPETREMWAREYSSHEYDDLTPPIKEFYQQPGEEPSEHEEQKKKHFPWKKLLGPTAILGAGLTLWGGVHYAPEIKRRFDEQHQMKKKEKSQKDQQQKAKKEEMESQLSDRLYSSMDKPYTPDAAVDRLSIEKTPLMEVYHAWKGYMALGIYDSLENNQMQPLSHKLYVPKEKWDNRDDTDEKEFILESSGGNFFLSEQLRQESIPFLLNTKLKEIAYPIYSGDKFNRKGEFKKVEQNGKVYEVWYEEMHYGLPLHPDVVRREISLTYVSSKDLLPSNLNPIDPKDFIQPLIDEKEFPQDVKQKLDEIIAKTQPDSLERIKQMVELSKEIFMYDSGPEVAKAHKEAPGADFIEKALNGRLNGERVGDCDIANPALLAFLRYGKIPSLFLTGFHSDDEIISADEAHGYCVAAYTDKHGDSKWTIADGTPPLPISKQALEHLKSLRKFYGEHSRFINTFAIMFLEILLTIGQYKVVRNMTKKRASLVKEDRKILIDQFEVEIQSLPRISDDEKQKLQECLREECATDIGYKEVSVLSNLLPGIGAAVYYAHLHRGEKKVRKNWEEVQDLFTTYTDLLKNKTFSAKKEMIEFLDQQFSSLMPFNKPKSIAEYGQLFEKQWRIKNKTPFGELNEDVVEQIQIRSRAQHKEDTEGWASAIDFLADILYKPIESPLPPMPQETRMWTVKHVDPEFVLVPTAYEKRFEPEKGMHGKKMSTQELNRLQTKDELDTLRIRYLLAYEMRKWFDSLEKMIQTETKKKEQNPAYQLLKNFLTDMPNGELSYAALISVLEPIKLLAKSAYLSKDPTNYPKTLEEFDVLFKKLRADAASASETDEKERYV